MFVKRTAEPTGTTSSAGWKRMRSCCTVVRTLEEAVADPHLTARGLFDTQAQEPGGRRLVSTPLPLAPVFREQAAALREVAASGADTERLLG